MLKKTQEYKIVDFYFEQKNIEARIGSLNKQLKNIGNYIPRYDLLAQKTPLRQLQHEEKIQSDFYDHVMLDFEELNTRFCQQNFKYVL